MKKHINYPEVTTGSILARKVREKCNKWTPEERKEARRKAAIVIKQINEAQS